MCDKCRGILLAIEKMEEIRKIDMGDEDDDHELYDVMNEFYDLLKDRAKYCNDGYYE